MPFLTLPASFRFPGMVTELAEGDGMYDGQDGHYVSVGLSALRAIEDALGDAPAPPRRILDLPCGHGRVTRVLRARFPEAAITVCDLDRGGVDFAAARFGARGVYSVEDFRELDLGEAFDLIWVGSLVTHLPELHTRRILDCMARHMAPRSVLVVTSHGARVEARLRSWTYGLAPEAAAGLLEDHARTGYAYRDYPGGRGSYGVSLTSRGWWTSALPEGPLRLCRYAEAAWDDHQDVLALRLREDGDGSSARYDTTDAAPRIDRGPRGSKKPWRGPGVRGAARKAAQAVSARLAGRPDGGRDESGAPAARASECWTMDEQLTRTHEAAPADAFDEAWYLASYPDVAEVVARGDFASGRAHYLAYGRWEGRLPSGAAAPGGVAARDAPGAEDTAAAGFDEAWYLASYPDVAEAVRRGDLRSGLEHYVACGRQEGRFPSPGYQKGDHFNEAWYAASYPMARREVETGLASSYAEHYLTRGRARGYLPNRLAPRPADPAAPRSRFDGFWPDRGNALDLVEGKLETGMITEDQAGQLRHWIAHGQVVLKGAIPAGLLDRAEEELDRAYRGEVPGLLFSCPAVAPGEIPWEDGVSRHPAKGLDLHWLSPVMRELIFAPELRRFLELVFERRVLASQSLAFLRGSAQAHHMDTFYVPYSSPMQFAASWIALEDVATGAGELAYLEGSHTLPEHLLLGEYKSVWEVQRMRGSTDRAGAAEAYEAKLSEAARARGMAEKAFLAKRGDVLIWHAGLAHGGKPISRARTRKSVVTHYCPREIAPLNWEQRPAPLRSYRDLAYYSSVYYGPEKHS